jgi:hypothetical protein
MLIIIFQFVGGLVFLFVLGYLSNQLARFNKHIK